MDEEQPAYPRRKVVSDTSVRRLSGRTTADVWRTSGTIPAQACEGEQLSSDDPRLLCSAETGAWSPRSDHRWVSRQWCMGETNRYVSWAAITVVGGRHACAMRARRCWNKQRACC